MSRVPSRIGIVVLLVSLGAACQKKEHVDAPTRVSASLQDFDTIVVTWAPPAGAETIEMDRRVDAGAWERYGVGGGGASSAIVQLTTGDAEAAKRELQQFRTYALFHTKGFLDVVTVGHHDMWGWYQAMADDLLSWPDLPAADRAEIRARMAPWGVNIPMFELTAWRSPRDAGPPAPGGESRPPDIGAAQSVRFGAGRTL